MPDLSAPEEPKFSRRSMMALTGLGAAAGIGFGPGSAEGSAPAPRRGPGPNPVPGAGPGPTPVPGATPATRKPHPPHSENRTQRGARP